MKKYIIDSEFDRDIQRVQQISIIPTLLDVICQTTGMGFAAVARVTQDRWITCSVRDDIQFGLVPGSELQIETTICNEIRASIQPVVIDHVAQDKLFCSHHTPAMYGFQSYISFPIILKTGEFFGTLCAIDPRPAQLDNTQIKGLFTAFAQLISFHLQQTDLLEQSDRAVKNLGRQLTESVDENRQYRHISNHSLQEPLRKLRLFSTMLVDVIGQEPIDRDKAEGLALKINSGADKFSRLIKNLSEFSILDDEDDYVQPTDLNDLLAVVLARLSPQLKAKNATLDVKELPTIPAMPLQLEQLFYHLIHNAVKFAKKDVPLAITISSKQVAITDQAHQLSKVHEYVEILVSDNGIGIEESQLEKIFDLFAQLVPSQEGVGFGLPYCRKVVRNHYGQISIDSAVGQGTIVSLILPSS